MSGTGDRTPSGLWINPAVGVAGDMLLAALVDLGASLDAVRAAVGSLGIGGWTLDAGSTTRRGLTATSVTVHAEDGQHHRPWSIIDARLADADLPAAISRGARRTFELLARAEAAVHGVEMDQVHFHEVGAIDALVDIVGTWAAWSDLGQPDVSAGPVGLGVGTVAMAHGTVAVPAPATLELLRRIPTVPVDAAGETATPTGVALLVSMVDSPDRWGPMPAGTVHSVGRGAGSWDPPGHANVVTAVAFEPTDPTADREVGVETVLIETVLIETTVDDVTPEVLGHVIDAAIAMGADDAWVLPVTMKKSRPGHQVRVLCSPPLVPEVRGLLARETGTLGWREWSVTKHELPRHETVVELDGRPVRIKVGPHGAKPEHDDVVGIARASGRSARDVAADAAAAFRDTLP